MRYRLGRAVRLVIALAFLVFMVPFLMSKLDSGSSPPVASDRGDDFARVRLRRKEDCSLMNLTMICSGRQTEKGERGSGRSTTESQSSAENERFAWKL